jgi:hypothetical protein
LAWVLLLISLVASLITPAAAQDSTSITLSFTDENQEPFGEPQTIPSRTCTLFTAVSVDDPTLTFTAAQSSDDHAYLNLYQDGICQQLLGGVVGHWSKLDINATAGAVAIRYEGSSPTSEPGFFDSNGFPQGLVVQTIVPDADNPNPTPDPVFIMDPAKGVIVVALVALVLVIGMAIGAYQVYKAAQYKPPPKPPKEPKLGVVGTKKVKKKQAYYKKPTKDGQSLLNSSSPTPDGASRSSVMSQHQHQPMQERTKNERLSVPISPTSPTHSHGNNLGNNLGAGSSTMNNYPNNGINNNNYNNNNYNNNNALPYSVPGNNNLNNRRNDVLIDIQDTSSSTYNSNFRGPWQGNAPGGGGSHGGTSTAVDLVQFGHDGGASQNSYRPGPSSYSSPPQPPGRYGEVLVPMHQMGQRPPPPSQRMGGRAP